MNVRQVLSLLLISLVFRGQILTREISPDDYSGIYEIKTLGNYSISKKNSQIGVFQNKLKSFIIPPNYKSIEFFIDKDTAFIASFSEMEKDARKVYDQVVEKTKKVNKQVLINNKNEIISNKYSYIQQSKKNKLAIATFFVDTINYQVLINIKGKELFKKFKSIGYNYNLNLYYAQEMNGKYGVFDHNFKIIIPFEYDNLKILSNDYNTITVSKDNKYGVIDLKNKILVPLTYGEIISQFDEHYIVENGNKQFIINNKNEITFNAFYDRIYNHDVNGNFKVKNNEKYGLMNRVGEILIPIENNKIYFEKIPKYYVAHKNNLFGVYDKKGKLIIPVEYHELILVFDHENLLKTIDYKDINRLIAVKDNKYGVIDMDNNIIIPFKYSSIRLINKKDKKNLIDHVGFIQKSSLKNYIYEVSENEKDLFFINEKNEIVKNK